MTSLSFKIFELFFIIYCAVAQEKAKTKCEEYTKTVNTFNIGRGIIGGRLSRNNEFPYMVAVGFENGTDRKHWRCGGTLISEKFVLTAAHCTKNGPVTKVRLGTKNLYAANAITIDVIRTIKHPDYKPPSRYNDIALLELKNEIKFFRSVKPACLNTVADISQRTNKLTATGWGLLQFWGDFTNDLRKVDLNLYSYQECKSIYASVSKRTLPEGIKDDSHLCAGPKIKSDEEKDTCHGDSGGPLAMKTGTLSTIVGITSFGKGCGLPNTPGVYTKVSNYVPWIEANIWH